MKHREAYRFIGLCIAALADERLATELASKLKRGQVDWPLIVGISSRQMVTPALFSCFKLHDLTKMLNPEVQKYLSTIHTLNKERNKVVLAQVREVVRKLNTIGVQPTIIKGAAHISTKLYSDPAARVMSDIDMLIPESQLMPCVNMLTAAGYNNGTSPEKELKSHHFPRLIHPDREVGVELHRWATSENAINVTEIFDNSQPWETDGVFFSIPSREHALMINIIHSHSGRFPGQPNFRSLMDHALLQNVSGEKPDWTRIGFKLRQVHEKRAMKAFLDFAHCLMKLPPPSPLQPEPHLSLARLTGKIYIYGRHFESAVLLTHFFVSLIEIMAKRFDELDSNVLILQLFNLKKWQNMRNSIKEILNNTVN